MKVFETEKQNPYREKEVIDRVIEPLAMSNGMIIPQKSATQDLYRSNAQATQLQLRDWSLLS